MDDMVEIRKSSLETLAYLSRTRMDVQDIILEIGILDLSLQYIQDYPKDQIDKEVLSHSLDIVSYIIQSSSTHVEYVLKKNSLKIFVS